MHKLQGKLSVICIIIFAVVVALLVPLAVPAIAATATGGPSTLPKQNFATVQGALAVSSNSTITITPNIAVILNAPAGQMVNIIYNKGSGAIQGLMLNMTGQPMVTAIAPPIQNFATVKGALAVSSNSTITITPNTAVTLNAPAGQMVNIVYNKISGAVQGLMLDSKTPTKQNFATVKGTLAVSSNSTITVVPNAAVTLNSPAGQTVTIAYNKSSGTIQGLMLNRSGPPIVPPMNPANQIFAVVQGALTVSSNSTITIVPNIAVTLNAPAGQMVTIAYDKSSGVIQGLMLVSKTPPYQKFATVQGTLSVSSNSTITIVPNVAVTLNAPAGQMVTIAYNKSSGTIQGLMLNRSGPPIVTPMTPANQIFAIVQGTLAVSSNSTITITPNTAVTLNAPAGQMVNIAYNKSSGVVQGLMLVSKAPPNQKFATVQGALAVSSNSTITITPNIGVTLNAPAGQMVNIIYYKGSGAIQGLMPNLAVPPAATLKTPPNQNFATVKGALAVSSNSTITITPNIAVILNAPAGQMVNIVYNKSSGAVQGLILIRSGQAGGAAAGARGVTVTTPASPTEVKVGSAFVSPVIVQVKDGNGNIVTTSTKSVTLSITPGTGASGAVLTGPTTVNAVNGVATFSGLSINLAGNGYTLTATSGTLSPAVTQTIKVLRPGDANGDGILDMGDVTQVERIILGMDLPTVACDVSGDGLPNMGDVTKIERLILGLDSQ
jgi:hypothetical protein